MPGRTPLRFLSYTFAYRFVTQVTAALRLPDLPESGWYFRDFLPHDEATLVTKMARPKRQTLLHDYIQAVNTYYLDDATRHWDETSGKYFDEFLRNADVE